MRRQKFILSLLALFIGLVQTTVWAAAIPLMVPYSGQIAVKDQQTPPNAIPFNGNGQFKFAIINKAECVPASVGCQSYWSNDLSKTNGSEPTAFVALPVSNGTFSVKLGDTTLTNMKTLSENVFDNGTTFLRVWFNDGTKSSFEQLSPDRQLASVPYAYRAGTADIALTSLTPGPTGPAGPQGPQGATGATGPAGVPCASCVDSASIKDGAINNAAISDTAQISDSKLAQISTAGKIAATALPSDGYATTYVNASGGTMTGGLTVPSLTYSPAKSASMTYAAVSFSPSSQPLPYAKQYNANGYVFLNAVGSGAFISPLTLPAGVTITGLECMCYDGIAAGHIEVSLRKNYWPESGVSTLTNVAQLSTTDAEAPTTIKLSNIALNEVITEGPDTSYWIDVFISTNNSQLGFFSVTVRYTYTSP